MPNEKTNITQHFLSDAERDRFQESLAHLQYDEMGPFNPFVRSANRAFWAAESSETADVLLEFKNNPRANGVLVIYNSPFDPNVQRGLLEGEAARRAKANSLSEAFLVGVVSQIGEPYSIHQEEAALVNNLCPSRAHERKHTGLGSQLPLGLHIENAAARLLPGDRSPEGLALTGVSKEPVAGPPTPVSDGRLALSLCDPFVEEEFRQPNFAVRFPDRWLADCKDVEPQRTVALIGPRESPSFVAAFYEDILVGLTPEARRAMAEFSRALESVATEVHIEPGMTVLVNNHFIFHGRGSFAATYDQDGRPFRWVQRVFWTSALRRMGEWEWVRDRVVRPLVKLN
jgi:L-asparagine oxygenase